MPGRASTVVRCASSTSATSSRRCPIRWLRAAGFDLRTHRRDGEQFGFVTAGGRVRGHIDGVIVSGPDIGVAWPALFEHKALNNRSWGELARQGVRRSKPIYYAQLQIYMAYMELDRALFTALNKDSQALHHEVVAFDARAAQALSDKAVDVIRAAEGGRVAAAHRDQPRLLSLPLVRLRRALLGGRGMSAVFREEATPWIGWPSPQQAAAIRVDRRAGTGTIPYHAAGVPRICLGMPEQARARSPATSSRNSDSSR